MALNSIASDPGAESYIDVAGCDLYHANLQNAAWALAALPAKEAALRRATSYIDNVYRSRFVGFRTARRAQALEWPRTGAYYYTPQVGSLVYGEGHGYSAGYSIFEYDPIIATVIPVEIANATCEAALREIVAAGSLAPDLERGGANTRSLKAGSVEIVYSGSSTPLTLYPAIARALSALLTPANPFGGTVGRA